MGWKNPPTNFGIKVLAGADDLTKKVTAEILQGVVISTPVDTGQARGNWRVKVGSVDGSVSLGATDTSGQGAVTKGMAVISQGKLIGKVTYVSNSLRYIEHLNSGWSMQAPINFVGLTIQRVSNKYK